MKALKAPKACLALLPLVCAAWTAQAQAQAPVASDGGAEPEAAPAEQPAYHGTMFFWENNVSAETIGVGDDVQSSNPNYTMGLGTKARYYLRDKPDGRVSVRADLAAYREFTNSDETTRRGELTLSDGGLALGYSRRLRGSSDSDSTSLEVLVPTLVLPTSRASLDSGRYFALGAAVGIAHLTPLLRGRVKPELNSFASFTVGYSRWFARAKVPTNPSLELERMGPDGRSVPTDQLSGSSLVRDQLTFLARWALSVGEIVTWTTDFGLKPAWKYDLADQVEVCGVVATGCATVKVGEDDSRYLLTTQFGTELSFQLVKSVTLDLGYTNISNQLGPDGRRRGVFYSPSASFYAALSFTPDELVTKPKRSAEAARPVSAF